MDSNSPLLKSATSRRGFLSIAALSAVTLSACGQAPRVSQNPSASGLSPAPTTPSPATLHASDQSSLGTTSLQTAPDTAREPAAWGTHLPGVHASVPVHGGRRTLALTFDACGGPRGSAVDHHLLDVLRGAQVPATLFLNERWMRSNPAVTADLASDPLFRLENHGTLHVPLSVTGRSAYGIVGTTNPDGVAEEIESNRRYLLDSAGVHSTWFRSGTAHYDDVAVDIARSLGVRLAGFTVNADVGATATSAAVAQQLLKAPDGAVVLAHMNQPAGGTTAGVRAALAPLRDQGTLFVHLGAQL
ncbi:polysaccharide deacetylase family protein [Rhodococcus qingshengii]|uniref:polysaccharide deacetylase family protein n=1 Tax=Rhodococcus qingshengii TaxID=334542 RepID=UPI0035D55035